MRGRLCSHATLPGPRMGRTSTCRSAKDEVGTTFACTSACRSAKTLDEEAGEGMRTYMCSFASKHILQAATMAGLRRQ
jgi:hypothetical protein